MSTTTEAVAESAAAPADPVTLVKGIGDQVKQGNAQIATLGEQFKDFQREVNEKFSEIVIGKDNELDDPCLGIWKNSGEFLLTIAKSAKGDMDAYKTLHDEYPKRLLAKGSILTKDAYTTSDSDILAVPLMDSEIMRSQAERIGLAQRARQFAVPAPHRVRDIAYRVDKDHSNNMGAANGMKVFRAAETVEIEKGKGRPPKKLRLEPQKVATAFEISVEELQMNPNAAAEAMRDVDEAFAFAEEEDIMFGTGGDRPIGFLATQNPSLITVLRDTSNQIKTIDLANMIKRTEGGLGGYVWIAGKSIIPQLVSLKHPTADSSVYVESVRNGEPFSTLFGVSLLFSDHAPTLGTQSDLSLVKLSDYAWATRGGRRAERSIHVSFLKDMETFKFVEYRDGKPLWNSVLTPKRGDTRSPFITLDDSTT